MFVLFLHLDSHVIKSFAVDTVGMALSDKRIAVDRLYDTEDSD